jgi:anti-sigma regulatory factor (Ser/Thr protein kinase)
VTTAVADEGAEARWPGATRRALSSAVKPSDPVSPDRAWCLVVQHHPRGARIARLRFATELAGLVGPALLGDASIVLAELVGNAVRHAQPLPGDVLRVAWRLSPFPDGEAVEVRVTDGGAVGLPRIRTVDADAGDGRGLTIVAALADRWGVDRDGLGQSVWAELSTRPALVTPDG